MTNKKELVLTAFETLFNERDYEAAAKFWSPDYIQHSAHIPPGRDGLFNLVKSAPPELRYENHAVAVDGDYVLLHGRFTGNGRTRAWIAGTSSASRTASSSNTGTRCRMKSRRKSRRADSPCLETASQRRSRS